MEEKILALLAHLDREGTRLDQRPVRDDLLTSREVALLLGAGALAAARVVASVDEVRGSIADMALAWRNVLAPAPPLPAPMCAVTGVTFAVALMAPRESVAAALSWLAQSEPVWEVIDAERCVTRPRPRRGVR